MPSQQNKYQLGDIFKYPDSQEIIQLVGYSEQMRGQYIVLPLTEHSVLSPFPPYPMFKIWGTVGPNFLTRYCEIFKNGKWKKCQEKK